MTYIALRFSRFVNGVAMQHGKVSRLMFPEYAIEAITNGVHAGTWTAAAMQALRQALPRWRTDNLALRYAIDIPKKRSPQRMRSASVLLAEVGGATAWYSIPRCLTIGFARRVATYKRGDLLFTARNGWRWREKVGGLQILYAARHIRRRAGKA